MNFPDIIILSFPKVSGTHFNFTEPQKNWLIHVQPVHQDLQLSSADLLSSPAHPVAQGYCVPAAPAFAEVGKAGQPMPQVVGLNGSPAPQHMNHFFLSQSCATDKLADSTLFPVMEAVNKVLNCVNPITNTWATPLAAIHPAGLKPLATTSCP